jgi:cell volume regulation protein A
MTDGQLILVGGSLLAAGLAASLFAARFRVPALVLVLGAGMLIGSDGTGWIEFDDYELARRIGIVALALILFEGGLAAGWSEIRPVLRPAVSLALVGTILTALLTGFVASWLFELSALEGLLVGSVIAATDAAAIFSVLRTSTLRRRLARTLEGESGLNDPVAVLLVIGFIDWIEGPNYTFIDMVGLFAQQLSIGLGVGLAAGFAGAELLKRSQLATGGLYPVATLAIAAVAFGGADVLHGSGFLAVYLAGLVLGSREIPARRTVFAFHEGLAWVAQVAMFFTLGLLVFPRQLWDVAPEATIVAFVSVAIARPLATFIATALDRFSIRERVILGWGGMRGAVPVVLATFPVIEGVPRSLEFFNIAFFAVLLSTVLQGATVEGLSQRLGLTTSEPALPRPLADTAGAQALGAEVIEFPIVTKDAVVGFAVRDLGLPREALVNVIVRGGRAIPPRGSTKLMAGDVLHILVREEAVRQIYPLLDRWRKGPIRREIAGDEEVWMTMPVYRARRRDPGDV